MPGLIALSTSDSRLDEKRLHFATRQPHLRARCNSAVRRRRWRRSWRTRLRARPTTPIPGSLRSSGPTRDASAAHWDDEGWARRSGLVMGFDTHMIAGSRACPPSTRLTHPTITSQTSPHYAGALVFLVDVPRSAAGLADLRRGRADRGHRRVKVAAQPPRSEGCWLDDRAVPA